MIKNLVYIISISILSSCVALGSPNTSPSNPINNDLPKPTEDALLAYLPLNGKIEDTSNNKVKVTLSNDKLTFTKDRNNKDNNSFKFDSGYLQIEQDINPSKYNKLTMTTWVKPEKFEEGSIYTIVSGDDGGFDRTIALDHRGEVKGFSVFAGDCEVFGTEAVQLNKWTFLGVVYDQDNKTVDFFVNDKKYSKNGCNLGESEHKFLRIGNNPSYGEEFYGDVDELRVYGRKLSDKEINDIFKYNQ